MERLRLGSSAAITKTLESGATVTVERLEAKRPIPCSVAKHEAAHVVAAGKIVSATIIPSGEVLGETRPVHLTASSAAAAAAMGYEGFGWDKLLTVDYLGVDWETAKAAARADLSGRADEMYEVATILQERGTIGQSDVEEARQNVKNRSEGIFPVQVNVLPPEGKVVTYMDESFHGEVIVADLYKLRN
ncbi:hypothetical protein A3D07_02890 [Candidatus Curtissbacteria bacterium RIFCSPHIGHO2_02_FULL_42_15]|uniref:Peptidase M41 domain-containing protein n=1 Tax=Candidatus Curtissbacteria bacterium RIFCSPHIGHO2_02_FULL_42_15 TaxID=1797716 RepID=A0A1F5GDD9_9BACT|nr:MAG: hypothetical protein A3D07_02890 [Candidatus Curtissbacteria bacterium RIFCSPHIGHO2_02_FULL_42_15]